VRTPKTTKNINQLFEEFLADQERRLATKTYAKYADMIDLFQVERIHPGALWLRSVMTGDSNIGPIPVPARVSRACKMGWDIGGIVGRTDQGWRLIEVWNLAP
jgi:hypothetical protein